MTEIYLTPNIENKPSSLRYFQEGLSDIDINTWCLRVTGEVKRELKLSFNDILELEQSTVHRRNVCVCLWSIKRNWEGTMLKDIMKLAGVDVNDDSLYARQISCTTQLGTYDSSINLRSAVERNAMLAHRVDGKNLTADQGFPLRLHDFGLYQYKCVKSLTEIFISRENKIGYWEDLAGYDVDGTIQAKRYYAVDLHKKFYFDGTGEIFDHDIE